MTYPVEHGRRYLVGLPQPQEAYLMLPEDSRKMEFIRAILDKVRIPEKPNGDIHFGICQTTSGQWYRVWTQARGLWYLIRYMDHGGVDRVPVERVARMPAILTDYPPLAHRCKIATGSVTPLRTSTTELYMATLVRWYGPLPEIKLTFACHPIPSTVVPSPSANPPKPRRKEPQGDMVAWEIHENVAEYMSTLAKVATVDQKESEDASRFASSTQIVDTRGNEQRRRMDIRRLNDRIRQAKRIVNHLEELSDEYLLSLLEGFSRLASGGGKKHD